MKKPQRILTLVTLSTILILTLVMVQLTGLIPALGTWYSYDPALRLQTDAFLRGELAIQPVPYGHLHDWAWGNGMHQVWGLGVPFLQFPFQVVGKLANGFGFPDRLIFLFFYLGAAIIFWRSLAAGSKSPNSTERLKWCLLTLPILLYAFLNHALINMMQGKFEPYEEVIAYGFLWSLTLFALLAIFLHKRDRYLYLALCFLSGFAIHLRPTIGAYGGMTFALAFFLAWRHKVKSRLTGLAIFLLVLGSFFALNALRFGSPLESGHKLGLSDVPSCNYVVKFDNPMTWIPFTEAAPELLSCLFFLGPPTASLENDELPWKASSPRIREINFKPFYLIEFILVLLAWALLVVIWHRYRQKNTASPDYHDQVVALGLIWSFGSVVPLFFFYTRWPGLVSRYLVDFAPAFIIAIASLYRYLLTRANSRLVKPLFAGILVLLTVITLLLAKLLPSYYGDPTTVTTIATAREKLLASYRTTGPPLPGEYRCGDKETRYEIPYNNKGWDISGNCVVGMVSTHFLERAECLEISFTVSNNSPGVGENPYSDQEIEVLVGIEPMHRVTESVNEKGKTITFCRAKASHPQWAKYPIELVSIKWLNLREHLDSKSLVLALLSLKKVK